MGLDMNAYATDYKPAQPVDFELPDATTSNNAIREELAYWRKHPNLHGWMEQLYRSKGGTADDFNCVNVALTAEDINQLEWAVMNDELPHTDGFFFGASQPEDKADDLKFIAAARKALADGKTVFYTSWW